MQRSETHLVLLIDIAAPGQQVLNHIFRALGTSPVQGGRALDILETIKVQVSDAIILLIVEFQEGQNI